MHISSRLRIWAQTSNVLPWIPWGLVVVVGLIFQGGCASVYPKFFDSPEFREVAVEMIRDSAKSWEAEGRICNPEIRFTYEVGVSARVIGVDGRLGARGVAPSTRPSGVSDVK